MKSKTRFLTIISLLIITGNLLLLLSFNSATPVKVYEPTKDFSFLKQPWAISRCVTLANWEDDKDFAFDSEGIVTNKKTYHPVYISEYALTLFDEYMKSKDEKQKIKFINQIKYLTNPKFYTQINDTVVAYPYTVAFHDLQAPWYSGLGQAEVLGVLVRYYYLTKDKSILPLMVKIKNMITLPVKDGGCHDTTAQGLVWIEEYPRSGQHKHVLNGFMVTLLLLDDYSKMFPDDKTTRKLIDDGYVSLKKSVSYYDTGNWLHYDRGTSSQNVKVWYMKAQVIESNQLYLINKDVYFQKLSLLWSTYCYNKVIGRVACIYDSANYTVPVTLDAYGKLNLQSKLTNVLSAATLNKITLNRVDTFSRIGLLTDQDEINLFKIQHEKNQAEPSFLELGFNKPLDVNQIILASTTDLTKRKVSFSYKSDGKTKWKQLDVLSEEFTKKHSKYMVQIKNITALRIAFDSLSGSNFIDMSEIKLNVYDGIEETEYVHYQTPDLLINNTQVQLTFDNVPVSEYAVFYKTSATTEQLKNIKYSADSATYNSLPILKGNNKVASFLIVFKRNKTLNTIKNFRLETVSK